MTGVQTCALPIYSKILDGVEREFFKNMIRWDNLVFVKESEDSKALVSSNEPCIVLSTAGMCQVGRVRHHLKSLVSNSNATILFVGFSTEGSLASILKDKDRKSITIDTKSYKCKCSSYSLKSMSGHTDFNGLCDYYSSINCEKIILHHGSEKSKLNLQKELQKRLSEKCKTTRVVCANSSLKFHI